MSNITIALRSLLAGSATAALMLSTGTAWAADNADNSAATKPGTAAGQSTTAGQAGQANDKNSLTTADIIVIGSRAAQIAPITSSLTTTQPQSAVSREFIDNANAASDFNQLIALTPGVSISGTANGTGFQETKAVIRGFQDGEYNVTYDSIPFADTNNPTHHSTAFFPSNTIETIVVDRGPGNASQLGQASYGGNINLYSRAATDERSGQGQLILGSFGTRIARGEYQSGRLESMGGAKFVVAGQFLRSDGALTNSPVQSKNLYAKAVFELGTANTLTVMSTWNRNNYYQSDVVKGATCGSATAGITGFTLAAVDLAGNALTQLTGSRCAPTSDVGLYGRDYGLSDNATLASNYAYNRTDKTTDFSYLRLQSDLGSGFSMDNRAYMYGYTNNTLSGNGTTSVALASGTNVPVFTQRPGTIVTGFSGAGTPASPYVAISGPSTNVSGYDKLNKYRVLGYIGQLNYEFSLGKVRLGGWFENADTSRHLFDFNWTAGKTPNYNEKFNNGNGTAAQAALPPISVANAKYDQGSGWNQYQLFGEFEISPVDSLAVTPGVKYVHFTRSTDAKVQATSRFPANTKATWTKTLPFMTVNWRPMSSWSFYAQYAQGMYVPDLSSFYASSTTTAAALTSALDALQPMTTTNYQVGTVWHGSKVSLDVDGYVINVNNKIGTCTTAGCDTSLLVNIGQVRYKGIEGQVSWMPITGLTLFANGSYNYAHSVVTNAQVAKAPFTTSTLGAAYNHEGLRVSFNQKFTGRQYANEYNGNPNLRLYKIAPYSVGEFAISKDFGDLYRVGASVSNVFDCRAITAVSTSSSGAPTVAVSGVTYQNGYGQLDQLNYLPPRSFMLDVRIKF
jgi:iron complex outermembrane receptor protein